MAWSRLQSASSSNNGSFSLGVPYATANLTSGSTLIAVVAYYNGAGAATTSVKLNDTAVTPFIKIATATATFNTTELWAVNTPSDAVGTKPTVTVTLSGSGSISIAMLVQEVSGLIASTTSAGFTDGTAGTSVGTTTGTTVGPPVYASAGAGNYLVYAYGDDGVNINWTAPGGYTADTAGIQASGNDDIAVAYKSSTGTTETGTYTLSSSAGASWGLVLVAFLLAGATGIPTGLASGAGAALGAGVVTSNVSVGPKYAGTGTDLGGVYGSWATPNYATGGP
jgi:hypothetical protein